MPRRIPLPPQGMYPTRLACGYGGARGCWAAASPPGPAGWGLSCPWGARPCCSPCDGIGETEAGLTGRCRCGGTCSMGWDGWNGGKRARRRSQMLWLCGAAQTLDWGGWMGCGKDWVPCSPVPTSPTGTRAPLSCTCRCASSIIVHAPSPRPLYLCACSTVVHAPSSRKLHHLACSIFACASLLGTLHRCARSVFVDAASCVLRRHALSIVAHPPSPYPPVATEDNPELGSWWQGGLCVGSRVRHGWHRLCPPSRCLPGSGTSPASKG